MTAQQFVFRFISSCLLLLAIIGIFNRLVDPFWYYRDINIKGFNTIKTKFAHYERDVKPALLIREQPEAIILGSSYAEIGFDPDNANFTDHGNLKSMNLALAGAVWPMVQCEFEFALANAPIKRALVGIQLGIDMPKVDCVKEFPNIGKIRRSELLFSIRPFIASIQTVYEQKTGVPSHTASGMYFYTRNKQGVDKRLKEDLLKKVQSNEQCLNPVNSYYQKPQPLTSAHFDLSGLQHILALAKKHHIQLVLFAYPHHAYYLELEQQCGDGLIRWQAMQQIAELNERKQGAEVAIWQFYGYNDLTTESIGTTAKYWQDALHFNFEMGSLLLSELFNESGNKPKYGRLITTHYLNADYQEFLQQRAAYLKQHPEFQSQLQALL